MDAKTEQAARRFLYKISTHYQIAGAILFGSRARGHFRPNSDLDMAVLLREPSTDRVSAALGMADIAFEVLLETGILVEALPLWLNEWEHPEQFHNPALIQNIQHEGIRLDT